MANNRHRTLYRYYKRHHSEFTFKESINIIMMKTEDDIDRACKSMHIRLVKTSELVWDMLRASNYTGRRKNERHRYKTV